LQNSQFKIQEIGIDAICMYLFYYYYIINYLYYLYNNFILDNTNNLKFELYVVHAEIDGIEFSLAYLFMENYGNCNNSIWTDIIIDFLIQLKIHGLELEFFLTDKNFTQISTTCFV